MADSLKPLVLKILTRLSCYFPALLGYDPRITKAIDQLLAVIGEHEGRSIDITKWLAFFVFDVMEDLAFNKSSNMLAHGEEAYIFKTIRTDMYNIAFFTHLPWLLPFLKRTPLLNRNYHEFLAWIQAQIDERAKVKYQVSARDEKCLTVFQNEPEFPDIFSWILAAYQKSKKTQQDGRNLHGDAQLIVIAGSDSVAAALTHLFFHLAHDAALVQRLQKELDSLPDLTHDNLVTLGLLDAVINEAMRLHPPVPSGTQRVTPPEGLWIGNVHIPGDVIVQVPSYTVFRGMLLHHAFGLFLAIHS